AAEMTLPSPRVHIRLPNRRVNPTAGAAWLKRKRTNLSARRGLRAGRYADQRVLMASPPSAYSMLLLSSLLTFAGCAAFGVPPTRDPATKLRTATWLFDRQDRPLPAERIIREALELYQKDGDQLGIAET